MEVVTEISTTPVSVLELMIPYQLSVMSSLESVLGPPSIIYITLRCSRQSITTNFLPL